MGPLFRQAPIGAACGRCARKSARYVEAEASCRMELPSRALACLLPWFAALCHALRLFARLPRASPGDRSSRRLLCARGLLQRVVCCQFSLHTNAKPWTHVFRILQKKGITTNPIGVAFAAARYGAVLGGVGLWMTSAPRFSSTIW
jgi:hypothetical protein